MYSTKIQSLEAPVASTITKLHQLQYIGKAGDNVSIDVNASQEYTCIEKLIVIMQQNRSIVHRGKSDCRVVQLHAQSYSEQLYNTCRVHNLVYHSGFIANWKDKIQGLFKDFQGPKIAVFKYQKYR